MLDTPTARLRPTTTLRRSGARRPPRTWRERLEHLADATGSTPARIAGRRGRGRWRPSPSGCGCSGRPPDPPRRRCRSRAPRSRRRPTSTTTVSELARRPRGRRGRVARACTSCPPGAASPTPSRRPAASTPQADAARINLAAPLTDGQRVYVLAVGEQEPAVAVGTGAPGTAVRRPGR